MNAVDDAVESLRCVNHPDRETYLRCGKCDDPICPKCTVPTPVGSRCRRCAQLRRLPQYEVTPRLAAPALLAGLAVSAVAWYLLSFIPFFRIFASVFVGLAVGEAVARAARRRVHTVLAAGAVVDILLGWILAQAVAFNGDISWMFSGASAGAGLYVALPLLLAGYFAYTRLR